jgi:hypothetical protein
MATHELLLMGNDALMYLLSVKVVRFPFELYTCFPRERIGLAVIAEI